MKIDKEQYKIIGTRIKKYREAHNMSQQALAKKLGYQTDTAVSLIENGDRKLSIEKLMIIADEFSIPLDELLGRETSPKHKDVITALRAEKDLSEKDKKQISDFIEFIKQKDNELSREKVKKSH